MTTREWIVIGQKFEVQTCRRPPGERLHLRHSPSPVPRKGGRLAVVASCPLDGAVTAGLGTETADWPPSAACGTALSGPRGRI